MDASLDDLLTQRKEARERAALLERTIKKRKKEDRALKRKLKGVSSEKLFAAAECARQQETERAARDGAAA